MTKPCVLGDRYSKLAFFCFVIEDRRAYSLQRQTGRSFGIVELQRPIHAPHSLEPLATSQPCIILSGLLLLDVAECQLSKVVMAVEPDGQSGQVLMFLGDECVLHMPESKRK